MKKVWFFFLVACHAVCFANTRESLLIEHVKHSLEKAENFESKLDSEVFNIGGMSGKKTRHFFNNLCSLPGARYFEVGVWKGSTLISALYGNENILGEAIAIDNWSMFGGPRDLFEENVHHFIPYAPLRFYEGDSFAMNKAEIFEQPINIFFYDGGHSTLEQKRAFTFFDDILDDVFIAVVDDWNRANVRLGTCTALRELQYDLLFEKSIYTFLENDLEDREGWWNGLYVFVAKKKTPKAIAE